MKECPKCNKQINDKEKRCPHCGHVFGYQRIQKGKKTPRKKSNVLLLFLTFAITSILTFSIFFDEDYFNELALYITDEDFEYLNSEDQEYIDAIASFESGLNDVLDDEDSMSKSYSFGMSSSEYAYFYPVYKISFSDSTTMTLELEYDLDSDNDYVDIYYTVGEYADFASMLEALQNNIHFETVINYLSPETSLLDDCYDAFVLLEEEFEERKDVLGNYGLNVTSDNDTSTCTYIITQSSEGYYLKQRWTSLLVDNVF